MTNITINEEKNGIEIRFDSKPEEKAIEELKANGFKWSAKGKFWYAKQNEERLAFANSISGTECAAKEVKEVKTKDTYDLFALTRTDGIKNNYEETHLHDCKEIAAIIRKHIRERFPMCKWSVRSSNTNVSVEVVKSPFEKDSDALNAICDYVYTYTQSWNYDRSDSMVDYFDVNFYGTNAPCYIPAWNYEAREMTVKEMNVLEAFNAAKAKFDEEERERERIEMEQRVAEMRKQREEARKREEERNRRMKVIEETARVVDDVDYFVLNALGSWSKVDSVEEVKRGAEENATRNTCRVSREIYLTKETYEWFSTQLMDNCELIAKMGGSMTDDYRINSMADYYAMDGDERKTVEWYNCNCVAVYCDDKLMLVIDPQGYDYARYVYIVDDEAHVVESYVTNLGITEEEHARDEDEAKKIEDYFRENTNIDIETPVNEFKKDERSDEAFKILVNHFPGIQVGYIRALKNIPLKRILYPAYNKLKSAPEQVRMARLEPGDKITIVTESDFGGVNVIHAAFASAEYGSYAQYKDAVRIVYRPEGKRTLFYTWFYDRKKMIILRGYHDLPKSVLYDIHEEDGMRVEISKYLAFDSKCMKDVDSYFRNSGAEVVASTI